MANKPTLEIPLKSGVNIKLLFDEPKIGHTSNGEWRLYGVLHDGVEKSYFASDKAHEMLQHYSKGDWVNIDHKLQSDGKKTIYEVTPGKEETANNGNNNNDKDLAIKWGMAFNNATRLCANVPDTSPGQRAILLEELMPEMFKIACSMPQEEVNKEEIPF